MLKAGAFVQNRYEIISRIGSGGMADVYKARDHKLNRFVAVKVLKPEFRDDKNFLSKFRIEAQSAAGLAHSNIVNVYDVGEDRGTNFIVMELVEGITLKTYINKKGRLSVRESTSIALQVAAGLEAAHNNGIVHRDVKPQNIIISLDGKAKVADFGIARAVDSNTINSVAMGSVHYSSPEQSRGGYSDVKSDIYSMGITMFEMLTGRVPFDGETTVEVALKHLQEEVPSPRKYTPEIPFSTEQIVLKCTQKSPDRRYSNMAELIRDLKESLVNPGGNFVTIPKLDRKANTILFSKEELSQLKKSTLPSYNSAFDTGTARNMNESGTVMGDGRNSRTSGSYYQKSSYQNLNRTLGSQQSADPYDDGFQDLPAFLKEEEEEFPDSDLKYDPVYDNQDDNPGGERIWKKRKEIRDHRRERLLLVGSIAAAVVVAGVILFLIARTLGLFGTGGTTKPAVLQTETARQTAPPAVTQVSVPDLLGKTEEEAQSMLKELSLGYKYQGESPSTAYPKGQIVSQSVTAGSDVEKNTTIGYVLSSGASENLTVPALAGMSEAEAEEALSSLGLLISVDTSRYSETVEEGYVITTNPGAGSTVKPGDTVSIYVSQGTESSMVQVPEVTGHYSDDASTMLNNLGLYVYFTSVASDTVEEGIVVSQDIAGGSYVQTGTAVTIGVSSGPAERDDITILDTTGEWRCNAQLNAPGNYNGEPVRIDLVQNEITTTIFEGTTTFPYFLNVAGQPGVTTGTVYIYTISPVTWEITDTTVYNGVVFSKSEIQQEW